MGLSSVRRDPVLRVTAGLFLAFSIPYFVPILPASLGRYYSDVVTTLPFLALAVYAFQRRLRGAGSASRRFWNLLTAAVGVWIVQQLHLIASVLGLASPGTGLVDDFLYVGLYSLIVLALDVRPHEPDQEGERGALVGLRRAGTVVFAFGMLGYLVLVPAALTPESHPGSIPSFVMYGVLDAYLVLRTAGFVVARPRGHWRAVYGWLLATFALWLVLDAVEGLMWAEVLPWVQAPSPWEVPWFLPLMTLIAAGRAGNTVDELAEQLEEGGAESPSSTASRGTPLILTTILVPLVHFAAYATGLFDARTTRAHELVALVLLLVLGGLTLSYQRILEARNRHLDAERREALARVEHDAYHDPLTDLPNRRLFWDRLGQEMAGAKRRREPLAILFFDLDGFKVVNDTCGHAVGDELLRRAARRIVGSVRVSDTVARLGGDEFVVVAPGVDSTESAEALARKIQQRLRTPYEIEGRTLEIDASVGISRFPEDGEDHESLVAWADSAMYEAKQESPGSIRLASPESSEPSKRPLVSARSDESD